MLLPPHDHLHAAVSSSSSWTACDSPGSHTRHRRKLRWVHPLQATVSASSSSSHYSEAAIRIANTAIRIVAHTKMRRRSFVCYVQKEKKNKIKEIDLGKGLSADHIRKRWSCRKKRKKNISWGFKVPLSPYKTKGSFTIVQMCDGGFGRIR